jgi:hypothetical protein
MTSSARVIVSGRPARWRISGVMGSAIKPDDERKDYCSRQNASQDNLNKRKVD